MKHTIEVDTCGEMTLIDPQRWCFMVRMVFPADMFGGAEGRERFTNRVHEQVGELIGRIAAEELSR